jgi:flagellar protein FlbD
MQFGRTCQKGLQAPLIKLRRLDGTEVVINMDLVEYLEATPDTVVSFASGHKMVVRDTIDEVIEKVIAFRRRIIQEVPEVQSRT